MAQVSAEEEVIDLKESLRTREVAEEELRCCERLIGLLRAQRTAVLGRELEAVGRGTALVDQELVRLQALRKQAGALPPASATDGQRPPLELKRRLERVHALLRLEGGITLELLTDLTTCLDHFLQALQPPHAQCYDAQGRRGAERAGEGRLDQEV